MTHAEFAAHMSCPFLHRSQEEETAYWREVCPNMTFDAVVAAFARDLARGEPDEAA